MRPCDPKGSVQICNEFSTLWRLVPRHGRLFLAATPATATPATATPATATPATATPATATPATGRDSAVPDLEGHLALGRRMA
jgi:hypothetical protein